MFVMLSTCSNKFYSEKDPVLPEIVRSPRIINESTLPLSLTWF